MGWRTLVALVFVVLGLLLTLRLTQEQPSNRGDVAVPLMAGHRLASATRIQWQFRDQDFLEIRREPGGPFRLVYPLEDLAAMDALASIASTYESAMLGETPLPDTDENRSKTGLDVPRLVVEVDFEDGAKERLEIGSDGPLGNDLFVRREGRIYRGGLALYTSLERSLDDLRERACFRTPFAAVAEVVVDRALPSGARETMRLVRGGDGWRMVEPIRAKAATAAANSFVGNLLALRIDLFVAGPLRLPDGPPDVMVTARGGKQDEVLKLWLDTQENLLGQLPDRGISFKSLNSQYSRIFKETAEELRSRILVPVPDIYHQTLLMMVDFGEGEPRLRVRRESTDSPWQLEEPIQAPAEAEACNQLLTALNNMRALAFLPADTEPAQYGLGPGGLRVALQAQGDVVTHRLRIGRDGVHEGLEVTYAAADGEPVEVVTVPQGAAERIRRPWTEYVPRRIFRVLEPVTRLDLARRDGGQRRLAVDASGRWVRQDGAPVRDELIADIADRLRDLRAQKVRLVRDEPLGEPDWSLVMGRNSDASDPLGFGALDLYARGDLPLLAVSRSGLPDVAYELSALDSEMLRRLWE